MERDWHDYVKLNTNQEGARAKFEKDCESLLKRLYPLETVMNVRANPGDHGIDVYVGNIGLEPIDVYQCKFFLGPLGKSQKEQIRESFERAATSTEFKVKRWVLCMPLEDFDLAENKWWTAWKRSQELIYQLTIELLNGSELIHRLKQTGLYTTVFQLEDSLRLADLHDSLVTDGTLAELKQLLRQFSAAPAIQPATADVEAVLDVFEQQLIRQHNPRTALRLLTQLGEQLERRHSNNASVLARYFYLLSLAHRECGEVAAARPPALRAYAAQSAYPLYTVAAAQAHAEQGDYPTAQNLAQRVLDQHPDQPQAHAVLAFCRRTMVPNLLAGVTESVAQQPVFRLTLFELLREVTATTARQLFGNDLRDFAPPTHLDYANFRYWAVVAQVLITLEVGTEVFQNSAFTPVAAMAASPRFLRARMLLGTYCQQLRGTEKLVLVGPALFLHGLAGYYLTGLASEFDEYQAIYAQQPRAAQQRYGARWAMLLSRWGSPQQVLVVLDTLDADQDENVDFLRFLQYRALRQLPEAKASLLRTLERAATLEHLYYTRATFYLLLFCPTAAERQAFVASCRERGQLTQQLPTLLLEAAALQPDEVRREEMLQLLGQAAALLPAQSYPAYGLDLAELYYAAREFEAAIATLDQLPSTSSERTSVLAEHLYISSLYELGRNSESLLERLAAWRQQRPAERQFCLWELELADLLGDWNRRLLVAEYGHAAFPTDPQLYWQYLYSLHLLGLIERLRPELEGLVRESSRLHQPDLFNAASIARQAGWSRLARELVYPLAYNPRNLLARDKFAHLCLLTDEESEPRPTEAEPGVTVVFTLDGKKRPPLTLTTEALAGQHPFAKQLLGLRPDDRFTVSDKLSGKIRHGVVVELLDAHTALFREITQQSEEQDGEFSLQTLHFDTDSIEDIERVLRERFGADEQARRAHIEQVLQECARGESGFSMLARSVCAGNGLDAYRLLTSSESAGFFITPLGWYESVTLTPELQYVLDWSTLPLFYQLHEAGLLTLPSSLWVSLQVPEFLQELIQEKERLPASRMSLLISETFVRPQFFADSYKEEELAFLRKLLAWVQQHCRWRLVTEKLDLLRQGQQRGHHWLANDDYGYFAGVLDTLFLAEQPATILVSDDVTINALLRSKNAVVSSEKYLRTVAGDTYTTHYLPRLLQLRYVGLALDTEVLFGFFINAGGQFTGLGLRYLESLPLLVRDDPQELLYVHNFLRRLHLAGSLSPEQISVSTVTVYIYGLRHLNLTPPLRTMVRSWIKKLFHLLPLHQTNILRDFDTAWQQAATARLLLLST
jgi:hypothetical protein